MQFKHFTFKNIIIAFACCLPLVQLSAQQIGVNPDTAAIEFIEPTAIYEYCKILTSPVCAGRLTGSRGYNAAAHWIEEQLSGWGLHPLDTTGGYLQRFPTEFTLTEYGEMTLTLPPAGDSASKKLTLQPAKDFIPLFFTDTGSRLGKAVFAGWGISAPVLNYDDYAGLDVNGKFVLCFRGTPDPTDDRFTEYDEHRTRMSIAHKRGALGIIYIDKEVVANPNGDWLLNFTPVMITEKIADMIFKEKGIRSDSLKDILLKTKKPFSFETKTDVNYLTRAKHFQNGTGYNIVGIIEGSDPVLKNEYVIVGAHADHCGQFATMTFPGADDNASGTAVVMEIGRTFALLKNNPKRSVVIALFGGEEMGLKGSEYFTSHLPPQFTKSVGMINFDMVGEGDGAECSYSQSNLKDLLAEADSSVGILRSSSFIKKLGVRSSDFAPFFTLSIPCLSFSSNGPHLYYHQTGDTYYRLNPDIMGDIARLGFRAAYLLANN